MVGMSADENILAFGGCQRVKRAGQGSFARRFILPAREARDVFHCEI
jgi:hypothetical protein